MDVLVKKAIIPIIIIMTPEIENDVFRPMTSATKPIPINPSIAGIRAIV